MKHLTSNKAMKLTLYERVERIIVKYIKVLEKQVTPEASFVDDLGVDSLDMVEFIMDIGEEFGVNAIILIDDEEKLKTMGDVVEYLRTKLPSNE